MKIVLTGSLGHIGKPLTKGLLEKGHTVTVISSTSDREPEIKQIGAIAATGSLHDVNFLTEVFTCADVIYTMVPPVSYMQLDLDPIDHFSKIGTGYKKAILASGVKQVVNLSSWGAHRDNGTGGIAGTYYLEKILNELPADISITHIRQ
jgi:nucleoside-diphosphate-sugar epimerase